MLPLTHLGNTDIYLLDQILKNRYAPPQTILDAGAGTGRNLHWFAQQAFVVYGTDRDPEAVAALRQNYPTVSSDRFQVATVESMPFPDAFFEHIICNAVLHFAENEVHFGQMFSELVRVLKPGGSLFIRVASDVGLTKKMIPLGNGRFRMPDGNNRFLLTRALLESMLQKHELRLLEPFKTVLVDDLRSMAVLVLGKAGYF
ncbi:MAG: class I SAM-dependent methyltransferase [Saprospiraceae bacterium]